MGFFRQHERLRAPQFWKGEEKSFVTQLEKLLDQLFNRKIGRTDLDKNLKVTHDDLASDFKILGSDIDPAFVADLFTKSAVMLDSDDDCNDCTASGLYYITTGVAHSPTSWCGMFVIDSGIGRDFYQIAFNEKGLWVRDCSGGPPSTWKEWRKFRGTYVPGQTVSAEERTIGCGYVTTDATQIDFSVPMPENVPNGNITITSLKVIVRGVNGYVDVFDWNGRTTERIGASGYTITAYGRGGDLKIMIVKSSALTNATTNTPVTVDLWGATFKIPS